MTNLEQHESKVEFIHGKNIVFETETALVQTTKTDYGRKAIGETRFFNTTTSDIPLDLKELSKEEEIYWNEVAKIKDLNSIMSSIKNKEKLLKLLALN